MHVFLQFLTHPYSSLYILFRGLSLQSGSMFFPGPSNSQVYLPIECRIRQGSLRENATQTDACPANGVHRRLDGSRGSLPWQKVIMEPNI